MSGDGADDQGRPKPSIGSVVGAWAADLVEERRLEAARLEVERLRLEAARAATAEQAADSGGPRRRGRPANDRHEILRRYEEGVRKARETKLKLAPDDPRQPTDEQIAEALRIGPRTLTSWRARFRLPAASDVA